MRAEWLDPVAALAAATDEARQMAATTAASIDLQFI
jgi:hypothetical protein